MTAAWASELIAAIVAICGMIITALRAGHREGAREGKIDAAIEKLTAIAEDHETRLRDGGL